MGKQSVFFLDTYQYITAALRKVTMAILLKTKLLPEAPQHGAGAVLSDTALDKLYVYECELPWFNFTEPDR